jgi:hypothetical protein
VFPIDRRSCFAAAQKTATRRDRRSQSHSNTDVMMPPAIGAGLI